MVPKSLRLLTDGHTGNPNPFLNDLQPNNQLDPSSDMQFSAAGPEQHADI